MRQLQSIRYILVIILLYTLGFIPMILTILLDIFFHQAGYWNFQLSHFCNVSSQHQTPEFNQLVDLVQFKDCLEEAIENPAAVCDVPLMESAAVGEDWLNQSVQS